MQLLIPPLLSFLVTFILVVLCIKFFPRLRLMDRPHEYGLVRKPIPYSVGIVFYIVVLVAAIFFLKITPALIGALVAGGLITLVSFIDDRIRLNPWLRLGAQLLAGIIVVFAGVKIQVISNPFGTPFALDQISFTLFGQSIWLFSMLAICAWLILMMNVTNWLDGIPGLASGISLIAQTAIFVLSLQQFNIVDQSAVIVLSSVLAAAAAAFLIFDFYPPKVLMGDTGSMFLGFMLGVLSILSGGKLATALLIMGFPVLDALWVILRRIVQKKSPLKGDYSHFHHQLLRVGFSERKALLFNYFFCGLFALGALALATTLHKFIAFGGVLVLLLVLGLFLRSAHK